MKPPNDVTLSKFMSLLLRHQPDAFGLAPDEQGYVPLDELVLVVSSQAGWQSVGADDLRRVVASSDKQRYEIDGDRIRARYGHSIARRITYPACEPPERLYHGTAPGALLLIRKQGLRAMSRQYVHCATEPALARQVGGRHAKAPVVLVVRALEAWRDGIAFYSPEDRIYLADAIPARYLEGT